jgi:hypothetical protein
MWLPAAGRSAREGCRTASTDEHLNLRFSMTLPAPNSCSFTFTCRAADLRWEFTVRQALLDYFVVSAPSRIKTRLDSFGVEVHQLAQSHDRDLRGMVLLLASVVHDGPVAVPGFVE